jgi:hypothetical protein
MTFIAIHSFSSMFTRLRLMKSIYLWTNNMIIHLSAFDFHTTTIYDCNFDDKSCNKHWKLEANDIWLKNIVGLVHSNLWYYAKRNLRAFKFDAKLAYAFEIECSYAFEIECSHFTRNYSIMYREIMLAPWPRTSKRKIFLCKYSPRKYVFFIAFFLSKTSKFSY